MSGGLLLAGDVYVGIFDSQGKFVGYYNDPINCQSFTPTPGDTNEIIRRSKMRATRGQALSSVQDPQPPTINFTTDSLGVKEVLRLALLGDLSTINEAAGAFTDEPVDGYHGKWMLIGGVRNLDSGTPPTVTDDTGATTYVEGTDYDIDYRNGLIKVYSTGAITDGESLLVDGTTFQVAGDMVAGFTNTAIKVRLLLDGKNLDSGKAVRCIVYETSLTPQGGADLLSDEFPSVEMAGTMVTPSGKTEPMFYEEIVNSTS